MRTNVSRSSIDHYHSDGFRSMQASQHVKIEKFLESAYQLFTGAELAMLLGIDKSAIAGRLNKLWDQGEGSVLRTNYKIICTITSAKVYGHYHISNKAKFEGTK